MCVCEREKERKMSLVYAKKPLFVGEKERLRQNYFLFKNCRLSLSLKKKQLKF